MDILLGQYKGLKATIPVITYTEDDVNAQIGTLLAGNPTRVNKEGPVAMGDTAVIDYEGFKDGVPFDGGKAEKYPLGIGSGAFIPGFEEQIVGMEIGEDRDINLSFPEQYHAPDLAGKEVVFKVKLHEIKKKEMPEINDEFAKDCSEFETLEELKKSIKERIEEQNKSKEKYELEENAIEEVCKNAKLEIPEGMIELEIDNMEKDIESRLSYQGINLEKYLEMIGKTREEFRTEYREQAEKQIKSRLVLEEVAKVAKITVAEEDIAAKISEMAKTYGKNEDEIKENVGLRQYVEDGLKTEKTINFIIEKAKIK